MRTTTHDRHTSVKPLLTIAAVFLVYGVPTLVLPVGRDQGLFMYIGKRLLAGETLYHDIWDVKSPLLYYTYGLLGAVFGYSPIGVRLGDLIVIAISSYLVFTIGSKLGSQLIGLIASILFVITYYQHDFRVLANSESLMLPLILLATLLVLRKRTSHMSLILFITGAVLCLAAAIKLTAIFFVIPVLLYLYWENTTAGLAQRTSIRYLWTVFMGILLTIAVFAFGMVMNGSLKDWIELNSVYLPHYASIGHNSAWVSLKLFLIWYLGSLPFQYPLLMICLVSTFVVLLAPLKSRPHPIKPFYLILALATAGVITVGIQGQYAVYHNIPFLPFVSILAANGVYELFRQNKKRPLKRLSFAILVLVLAVSSWRVPSRWGLLVQESLQCSSTQTVQQQFSTPSYDFNTIAKVSRYVADASHGDDKLLVWTFEPEIYFLSGLQHSSRFLYNTVFVNSCIDSLWRRELIEDMLNDLPAFVVIGVNDGRPDLTGKTYSSLQLIAEFPALEEILESHYRVDTLFDGFVIEKRK